MRDKATESGVKKKSQPAVEERKGTIEYVFSFQADRLR